MRIPSIIFLLFMSLYTCAQSSAIQQVSIEIDYSEELGIHFIHLIEKGNTLYSLSKLFQVSIDEISNFNNLPKGEGLRISSKLFIPFDAQLLYKGASITEFKGANFIPVYYTIKPKETLYKVSRVYFGQDMELILERNDLLGTHLNVNQKLLMGWIPVEKDFKVKQNIHVDQDVQVDQSTIGELVIDPDSKSNDKVIQYDVEKANPDTIDIELFQEEVQIQQVETGLAYWNKEGSDNLNLFVLHPTAKINSLIEIFNPQLQRKTFAKVLGRIPSNMYAENIDLIVSPRVARVLGVFNSEFRVTMKYYTQS